MVEPAGSRGSLAVVAVFALGVVLGAALAAAIAHAIGPSGSVPPLRVGPAAMDRLARHLDLDPEQREKVRAILGRNRQKVRDLFEQTGEEIRGSSGPNSRKHSTEFTRPHPTPASTTPILTAGSSAVRLDDLMELAGRSGR